MENPDLADLNFDSAELARIINEGGTFADDIGPYASSPLTSVNDQQPKTFTNNTRMATKPAAKRANQNEPYVEIIEQPQGRGLRFRYECEGRTAGSIVGETSSIEKKTFPTIKIHNHDAESVVVVSCVTKEDPVKPHPHSLVGRDCLQGVCTVKLKKNTRIAEFQGLGIQCAKKREVAEALAKREEIRVDPFGSGFSHKNTPNSISLVAVRLCFQVFLPDKNGKFTRVITPVVSQAIYDKKAKSELTICRVDKHAGSVKGNEEVFLLCEKVNCKDIEVRFFEEDNDDGLIWEAYGSFGQGDVHRQYAIVFKTPMYRDQSIKSPVNVWMQLKRPSDGEMSEPKPFQYIPLDDDPEGIEGKRKRKRLCMDNFMSMDPMPSTSGSSVMPAKNAVCEKLSNKIKSRKRSTQIKQENPGSPMNAGFGQTTWTGLNSDFGGSSNHFPSETFTKASTAASSTIDTSALPGLASITGPPGSYTQPTFSPAPPQTTNAQDLLGTLSDGGNTFTMDENLFKQQIDLNAPHTVYLEETVAGLTGDLVTVDYDPNIGAHENVVSMGEGMDDLQIESGDIRDLLSQFASQQPMN